METPEARAAVERAEVRRHLSEEYARISDGGALAKLDEKLAEWERGLRERLQREMPFSEHRHRLWFAELENGIFGSFPEAVEDDLCCIESLAPECNPRAWPEVSDRNMLIGRWRALYTRKFSEWQDGIVSEERGRAIDDIGGWMDRLEVIRETFEELGVDSEALWDTGAGSLCDQDVELLREWIGRLRDDPRLMELCEILGRAISENDDFRERPVQINKSSPLIPIVTSKEEIKGIELCSDIDNAVPSEFLLMGIGEASVLFDLKFAEGKLLCFHREGFDYAEDADESEIVGRPEKKRGGPVIICVDSSGSMAGVPENIAKAVAVSISMMALSQRRRCHIINFSTKVDTMEFGGSDGMSELISFLRTSFHGGTDLVPALRHGMSVAESEGFKDADILAVSDFFAPEAASRLCEETLGFKEGGGMMYSLAVGSYRGSPGSGLFDREFVFNPDAGSIPTTSGRTV